MQVHRLLGQRGVAGDVLVQRLFGGAFVDERPHAVVEALRDGAFDEDALAGELVDDFVAAARRPSVPVAGSPNSICSTAKLSEL